MRNVGESMAACSKSLILTSAVGILLAGCGTPSMPGASGTISSGKAAPGRQEITIRVKGMGERLNLM